MKIIGSRSTTCSRISLKGTPNSTAKCSMWRVTEEGEPATRH